MAKPGALPPVLPVVLYNGDARWKPATEMRDLIAAPSPLLAPYQPSQRHFVLDQRHARVEDFKLLRKTPASCSAWSNGTRSRPSSSRPKTDKPHISASSSRSGSGNI